MAEPSSASDLPTLLAELERLEKEATPGPWCTHPNGTSVWNEEQYHANGVRNLEARLLLSAPTGPRAVHWDQAVRDLDFVTRLRNAAPALIAAARRGERLEAALDALARNAYSGSAAGFARAALEEKP